MEKTKPVGVIYPVGGEPLFEEPGTGLRLTASDFAGKYGYEKVSDIKVEELNDRWTPKHTDKKDSTSL
jgi:hypothetical protein